MSACPSADRWSAYADGALPHRDRERAAGHLLDCADCRAHVRELRALRDRVRRAPGRAQAPPGALAARLVEIAGDDAAAPLTSRPFSGSRGAGVMPSRRRRLRRAMTVVGAGASTLVVLLVAIGWAAAPLSRARVVDPRGLALGGFAAALGAEPVANPAVTAALTAPPAASTTEAASPESPVTTGHEGAYARLERAESAARTVAYAGTQVVQVRHLAGFWRSRVEVTGRPGVGVEVTVNPGTRVARPSALLPEERTSGVPALAAHHQLVTGDGPVVAGRPSHVVEAREASGALAARWWVDRDTGLLLWSQGYADGRLVQSAGFESLSIGATGGDGHVAPRLLGASAALALGADPVGRGPEPVSCACPARVGGLALLSRHVADGAVHLAYGDGVSTISVVELRGALDRAPAGMVWDPTLRAYRSQDLPTMLVWQSGDRVLAVVTDGAADGAEAAVRDLPHQTPVLRTRTDRVLDGWRALLGA